MVFVADVAETELWTHKTEAGIYGQTMHSQVVEASEGQAISPKQSKKSRRIRAKTQNAGKQSGTDLKTQGKEDQRGTGDSNQGGPGNLCGGKKNCTGSIEQGKTVVNLQNKTGNCKIKKYKYKIKNTKQPNQLELKTITQYITLERSESVTTF